MRTVERAKKLFVAVVVAAVVYNIPPFFERQVVVETNSCAKQVSIEVSFAHALRRPLRCLATDGTR